MTNTTTPISANQSLVKRLHALSRRGSDLYERDVERSRIDCFHSHCRRVWEQLDPREREAMRDEVEKSLRPIFKPIPSRELDYYSIDHIKKLLAETFHVPAA